MLRRNAISGAMISVVIECGDDDAALAGTLAALVPGAVEGLIADVTVIVRGADAATRSVAEAAGCRLVERDAVGIVFEKARGDWLLLLEPGARLVADWVGPVSAHLGHDGRPARFSRARIERGSIVSRFRERRSPLAFGLLSRKAELVRAAEKAEGLRDVARGVKTIRLDCAIVPAGRRRA